MLCVRLFPGSEGTRTLNVTIRQLLQCLKEKIPAFLFDYSETQHEGAPPTKNANGLPIISVSVAGDEVTIYTPLPVMTLRASGIDTNIVRLVN